MKVDIDVDAVIDVAVVVAPFVIVTSPSVVVVAFEFDIDIGISSSFCMTASSQYSTIPLQLLHLFVHTFFPTSTTFPSALQLIVKHPPSTPCPPTSTLLTQFLLLTSQNRTVPSLLQLATSDSRTGLNATFSIPPVWPRSSVLYFTFERSGFQIRSVRSAEPVAISVPVGFQDRVRRLEERRKDSC